MPGEPEFGDAPALIDAPSGRTLTYAELAESVRAVAGGLADRGFGKREVFAHYAPNCPEYAVAFHAVATVGGVNTTANPQLTEEEFAVQLRDSGARLLVTIPELVEKATAAARQSSVEEIFVYGEAHGATPFASLRAAGEPPPVAIDPAEDLVALPYSSGTTRLPKGVMLTHRNLVANICQVAARVQVKGDGSERAREVAVLPFFHIYVDLYASGWALPELVEATARCGQLGPAQAALKRLAAATRPAGTDWGLGLEARSRALLSEGAAADGLYREAIDRLRSARLRPELARAHLLYGEWLRRESRRVDARAQLRAAHEHFASIGMEAFAERSRRELVATGENARKRTVDTRDALTAQQRQIAQLARDGLSNADIGARLFLSPRTVEWHLGKVFGKLGIRSRHELASALPSSESELLPV